MEDMKAEDDTIQDGWTASTAVLKRRMTEGLNRDQAERQKTLSMLEHMEGIRARVDTIVQNKDAAEALKPWYSLWCKRPTFHDEYLPTFNRPNVTLVDVSVGGGVQMFTKTGLVANGKEYALDAICIATGFETTFFIAAQNGNAEVKRSWELARQNGYDIIGMNGVRIEDHWANGLRTVDSYSVHGFPNLWLMNGPQGVQSIPSAITQLDFMGQHMAHMVSKMLERGQTRIECKAEAEQAYCDMIYQESDQFVSAVHGHGQAFYENCTPGYYNSDGQMRLGKTLTAGFKGNDCLTFFEIVSKRWEEDRAFDDYEVL